MFVPNYSPFTFVGIISSKTDRAIWIKRVSSTGDSGGDFKSRSKIKWRSI